MLKLNIEMNLKNLVPQIFSPRSIDKVGFESAPLTFSSLVFHLERTQVTVSTKFCGFHWLRVRTFGSLLLGNYFCNECLCICIFIQLFKYLFCLLCFAAWTRAREASCSCNTDTRGGRGRGRADGIRGRCGGRRRQHAAGAGVGVRTGQGWYEAFHARLCYPPSPGGGRGQDNDPGDEGAGHNHGGPDPSAYPMWHLGTVPLERFVHTAPVAAGGVEGPQHGDGKGIPGEAWKDCNCALGEARTSSSTCLRWISWLDVGTWAHPLERVNGFLGEQFHAEHSLTRAIRGHHPGGLKWNTKVHFVYTHDCDWDWGRLAHHAGAARGHEWVLPSSHDYRHEQVWVRWACYHADDARHHRGHRHDPPGATNSAATTTTSAATTAATEFTAASHEATSTR